MPCVTLPHVACEGLRLEPKVALTGSSLSFKEVSFQRMWLFTQEGRLGRRRSGPRLGDGPGRCLLSPSLEQTHPARDVSSMTAVRYPARGPHNPIQTTLPYPPRKKKENGERLEVPQDAVPILNLPSLASSHSSLDYPRVLKHPLFWARSVSPLPS